jgi:hypothetical protein
MQNMGKKRATTKNGNAYSQYSHLNYVINGTEKDPSETSSKEIITN